MWTFEKIIKQAQFVNNFECGWMNRIAAEITQKVRVLFEHQHRHPGSGQKESEHHAGRSTTDNAASGGNDFGRGGSILRHRPSRPLNKGSIKILGRHSTD